MSTGSNRRKLTSAITIRMSPGLRRSLDAVAREHGLSAASFLRDIAAQQTAGAEIEDDLPSPPRAPLLIPNAEISAVRNLAAQLAMVGGVVVQLCKALRESAHPAHLPAEDVLADLRGNQRDLVALIETLKAEVAK